MAKTSISLVHEAYLRLLDVDRVDREGRNHLFAASAQTMRRILVDAAQVPGISAETVMRDWRMARLWLQRDVSAT